MMNRQFFETNKQRINEAIAALQYFAAEAPKILSDTLIHNNSKSC